MRYNQKLCRTMCLVASDWSNGNIKSITSSVKKLKFYVKEQDAATLSSIIHIRLFSDACYVASLNTVVGYSLAVTADVPMLGLPRNFPWSPHPRYTGVTCCINPSYNFLICETGRSYISLECTHPLEVLQVACPTTPPP